MIRTADKLVHAEVGQPFDLMSKDDPLYYVGGLQYTVEGELAAYWQTVRDIHAKVEARIGPASPYAVASALQRANTKGLCEKRPAKGNTNEYREVQDGFC